MITTKRQEELQDLMEFVAGAGDNYYHDMDKATFDRFMKGQENEEYYKFHMRQRLLGMDAIKAEAVQKMRGVTLSEELQYMLDEYNYDDGTYFLDQLLDHPSCDFASVLQVYWALQPDYFYENYSSMLEAANNTKSVNSGSAAILYRIEQSVAADKYPHHLPEPDLTDFANMGKEDYEKVPFDKIPERLRIYNK